LQANCRSCSIAVPRQCSCGHGLYVELSGKESMVNKGYGYVTDQQSRGYKYDIEPTGWPTFALSLGPRVSQDCPCFQMRVATFVDASQHT
jgi:hypothetical protein